MPATKKKKRRYTKRVKEISNNNENALSCIGRAVNLLEIDRQEAKDIELQIVYAQARAELVEIWNRLFYWKKK